MQEHQEYLSDIDRYILNHKDIPLSSQEPAFDHLLRYLQPFKKIDASLNMLEVGTGMGWGPTIAKKRGLRFRGLEISPVLAEAAREYGRQQGYEPDIVVGNVENADLGENVYDVVIANSVFEHVEYWRQGLERVYRALKPGGALFFESTNKFAVISGEYAPLPFYGALPEPAPVQVPEDAARSGHHEKRHRFSPVQLSAVKADVWRDWFSSVLRPSGISRSGAGRKPVAETSAGSMQTKWSIEKRGADIF